MAGIKGFHLKPFHIHGNEDKKASKTTDAPLQHKLARHKVLVFYRICIVVVLVCVFLLCGIGWQRSGEE